MAIAAPRIAVIPNSKDDPNTADRVCRRHEVRTPASGYRFLNASL
jgi:hypothetical protein